MNTTEKTPLWLDLRKEYIDDNFEKLQTYLKECSTKKQKDSYEEDEDRKTLTFNVRLLATYLLADGENKFALPAYIAFMGELRTLNPRMSNSPLPQNLKTPSKNLLSTQNTERLLSQGQDYT